MNHSAKFFAAACLGLSLLSVSAHAQTSTTIYQPATGAVLNWNNASNWSNGIPTSSSEVTVGTSTANIVSNYGASAYDVTVSAATININSGGNLTTTPGGLITLQSGGNVVVSSGGTLASTGIIMQAGSGLYLNGDASQVGFVYGDTTATVKVGSTPGGVSSSANASIGDVVLLGGVVLNGSSTLTVNATNTAYDYTFTDGGQIKTYSGSVIFGAVSGTGNLVVTSADGSGNLFLGGINTYTGTTTVNHATLYIGSGTNLDTGAIVSLGNIGSSSAVNITNNGTLDISELSNTLGGTVQTGIQNLSGDSTATVNLGANTLQIAESAPTNFQGDITGTGNVIVAGTGTLTLTGANSYTGSTIINSGSTLSLAGASGVDAIASSSQVQVNGTLDISHAATAQTAHNLSGGGSVTLGSEQLNAVQSGNSTFSGVISGNGMVAVSGTGTLTLTGANSYSGGTTISGGTLQLGNGTGVGSLGTGTVTIGSGGTLNLDYSPTSTYTLQNALSGTGTLSQNQGNTVIGNNHSDSGFTGAVNVNGGTMEIDNTAFGATTVNLASGTVLKGTGTIAGTVNVNGGTLEAGVSNTIGGTLAMQNLSLTSASTVLLRASGTTIDKIKVNGSSTLAGTLAYDFTGAAELNSSNQAAFGSSSGSFDKVTFTGGGAMTIDDTVNASAFNSAILIDQGTSVVLSPTSTAFNAGTSITVNGSLNASAASTIINNLWGSGAVDFGSTNYAVINETVNTLYSGTLAGVNMGISGAGTLVLTGNDNAVTTYIQGNTSGNNIPGHLQVGNGGSSGSMNSSTLWIDSGGTVNFDHSSGTTSTFSGSLIGSGGTLEVSGGNLVLASGGTASAFAGATSVTGGALEVDNTLASTGVTVTGGALLGTGTINSNVTMTDGRLSAGTLSTPGRLTINGNLTMNSDSTATFRKTASAADEVQVNGNATVAGTASFQISGVSVRPGDTFTVIQETGPGTISGQFATVTNALQNALQYTSQNVGGNEVEIVASQGSFTPFANSGNQAAVAAALNRAANDPRASGVIDYLNNLQGSQLGAAMNQMTPTPTLAVPIALRAFSDNVGQTLTQRMGSLRSGTTGLSIENMNLGENTVFDPRSLLADDSNYAPIGYTPLGADFLRPDSKNRWGSFVAGLGTQGTVDNTSIPGYNYYAGGVQAGVDYRLTRTWVLGLSAGYQHGSVDFNQSSSSIDTDTGNAHLYSTWNDDSGDWLAGSFGGAYDWLDSKRESLGGTASAKPHGHELDGLIQYGHDFQTNGNWIMTPTLGLLYDRITTDSYTETGSLTPLNVDSNTNESFRTRVGIALSNSVHAGTTLVVNPYFQIGWQHEYLDQNSSVNAGFASGAGGVFSTTSQGVGADSAFFGAGLSSMLSPSLSLSVGYFGEANSDYLENNLQGTVRYEF